MLFIFLFVWKRISDTWSSSCWPTRGELLWDDRSLANRHVFACGQGCFPSVLISFFFISKASSYQCHLLHNLCTFATLVLPWDRTLNTFEYLSGRPQNMCTVTIFWLSCGLRSHWEVNLLATSPAPPFGVCLCVIHMYLWGLPYNVDSDSLLIRTTLSTINSLSTMDCWYMDCW